MKKIYAILYAILLYLPLSAQQSEMKKCTYDGPELSFAFLYPTTLHEAPTVRPHIKRCVKDAAGFTILVGIWEISSADMDELRAMSGGGSILGNREVVDLLYGGDQAAREETGLHVDQIRLGDKIDKLPTALISGTMSREHFGKMVTMVDWTFLLFYKNYLIRISGGNLSGDPNENKNFTTFLRIANSFSVLSQYK